MKIKYLITGASGQLAKEFIHQLKKKKSRILALTRQDCDISDRGQVFDVIRKYQPDIILNCAAYNNVDKAEKEYERALAVNAKGVKTLCHAGKISKALIVHFSTDAVFDGTKNGLYTERDKANPVNKYARSKWMGEKYLKGSCRKYLLIRTSWVFGEGKQNFLYKLKTWSKGKKVIKVSSDQVSIPSYTEDIAKYTLLAIKKGLRGLYHLCNSGYASRSDLARYYYEKRGDDKLIIPVASDYFAQYVKRPQFSPMSNERISKALKVSIPDWKDAVDRYIKRFKGI